MGSIHYALFHRVGHGKATSAKARSEKFMRMWVATQNSLHPRENHPTPLSQGTFCSQRQQHPPKGEILGPP